MTMNKRRLAVLVVVLAIVGTGTSGCGSCSNDVSPNDDGWMATVDVRDDGSDSVVDGADIRDSGAVADSSDAPGETGEDAGSGETVWTNILGADDVSDTVKDIATSSAGEIYVVGRISQGSRTGGDVGTDSGLDAGTTGDTADSSSGPPVHDYLAKYSSDGTRQWLQIVQRNTSIGANLAVDTAGNVYVTGESHGTRLAGQTVDGRHPFVAKYSPDGRHQSLDLIRSTDRGYGWDITADGSGAVYAVGWRGDNGFVAKYTQSGNRAWIWDPDLPGKATPIVVAGGGNGELYVAGATEAALAGQSFQGKWDTFVAKFDAGTGRRDWTRLVGSPDGESPTDMVVSNSGSIYVVGMSRGDFAGKSNTGGGFQQEDYFVAKYDTTGNRKWARLHGWKGPKGPTRQKPTGIEMLPSGQLLVAGWSWAAPSGQKGNWMAASFVVRYGPGGKRRALEMIKGPEAKRAVKGSTKLFATGLALAAQPSDYYLAGRRVEAHTSREGFLMKRKRP